MRCLQQSNKQNSCGPNFPEINLRLICLSDKIKKAITEEMTEVKK